MADIAELAIKVESKEVAKATKDLSGFNKAAEVTTTKISGMGKAMGAAAAAFALGGFATWIKGAIDAADAAGKTAAKVGVTVEALTGLQFAGELAGVSNEAMATTLKFLGKNASEAASGTGKAATAFKAMGINAQDASGQVKSADVLLLEIADSFAQSADGAGKVAAAMATMGRAGVDMIPMLNGGSEAIRTQIEMAQKLGLVLSAETAKAAEEFNDNLTIMGKVTEGTANILMAEMAPALADVTGAMVDLLMNSDLVEDSAAAMGAALKGLVTVALAVGAGFTMAGQRLGGFAAAAASVASGEFAQAGDILKMTMEDNVDTFTTAFETAEKMWDGSAKNSAKSAGVVVKSLKQINMAAEETGKTSASAATETEKMTAAIDQQVAALQLQAATLGMTTTEATEFKMAMDGATQAQLESARAAMAQIDAHNAAKASQTAKDTVNSQVQGITDSLMTEEQAVQASYERRRAIILASTNTTEAERAAIIAQLETQRDEQLTSIQTARISETLQNYGGMFDALAGMAAAYAGEQSGIARGMFAVSKAFALADSIVKIQQGIAGAAAVPFPANLAAMATVAAATAGIVATIAGTSFEGGGFTGSGSRTGGVDGKGGFPAILHPNETVVDHTKGGAMDGGRNGGNQINMTVVTPDADSFRRSNRQISQSVRRGISA